MRWLAIAALMATCPLPAAAKTTPSFVSAQADGLLAGLQQPPALGSPADLADLEAVLIIQPLRTRAVEQEAAIDGDMKPLDWAQRSLGRGYDPKRYPAAFALFEKVRADMTAVVDDVKRDGPQRKRPHQRDDRVKPSLSIEGHGSNAWPSGRAAATRVWAYVLADLFPERAEALGRAAERSAELRVIGGVHYPSDLIAGKALADAFIARLKVDPDYLRERDAARAEIARSTPQE